MIRDPRIDFVAFTGSVAGGRAVQRVAAERFIGVGLELGGCDPVYVRHDADLPHAIENIVDGAYFNSGQSCCGLQRIYVHESVYERFTARLHRADPSSTGSATRSIRQTTLGSGGAHQRGGCRARADPRLDGSRRARRRSTSATFRAARPGTPYLAPQLLLDAPRRLGGDARGDLRAGRRRHEGALGRARPWRT